MFEHLYLLVKVAGFLQAIYVYYFVHILVVSPYLYRRTYQKYTNVAMAKKFHPGAGDAANIQSNEEKHLRKLQYYYDEAIKPNDIDIRLT